MTRLPPIVELTGLGAALNDFKFKLPKNQTAAFFFFFFFLIDTLQYLIKGHSSN